MARGTARLNERVTDSMASVASVRLCAICQPHVRPDHQPAQAGLAAGLAADWSLGVQVGRPCGDLVDLHLLDLADDRQHGRERAARTAGLHERGARSEPVAVEDPHQDPAPIGAALHPDRRAPGNRHRMTRHRRLLGMGRVEQPVIGWRWRRMRATPSIAGRYWSSCTASRRIRP